MTPFTSTFKAFPAIPSMKSLLPVVIGQRWVHIAYAQLAPLGYRFGGMDKHMIPDWRPCTVGSTGVIEHRFAKPKTNTDMGDIIGSIWRRFQFEWRGRTIQINAKPIGIEYGSNLGQINHRGGGWAAGGCCTRRHLIVSRHLARRLK